MLSSLHSALSLVGQRNDRVLRNERGRGSIDIRQEQIAKGPRTPRELQECKQLTSKIEYASTFCGHKSETAGAIRFRATRRFRGA